MASVEDGNRKEVDHSEVDADDGREDSQTQQAPSGLFAGHFSDHDGAANFLGWNDPLDEFYNPYDSQFNHLPGLSKPTTDGYKGTYFFVNGTDGSMHHAYFE